jgi:hypothetical protein
VALVFTATNQLPEKTPFVKLGNAFILLGTVTFSGSYATGGDAFTAGKSPEDTLKTIGAGQVLAFLSSIRGNSPDWVAATRRLRLYASANTEVAAAAYNAALTASPVPVVILGR